MSKPALIVRQTSKTVEKIPEDDENGIIDHLLKDSEKTENEYICSHQTHEHLHTCLKGEDIANDSKNNVRTPTICENGNSIAGLTLNGNLHIIMPNTDSTCDGAISYRNKSGDENGIDIEKGFKKRKSFLNKLRSKISKQTVINVIFGVLISSALIIGLVALFKEPEEEHSERYYYCYPCQNIRIGPNIKRLNNMCCSIDPIEEFPQLKTGELKSENQNQNEVGISKYNGTRILEFQADFHRKWGKKDRKDIIPWIEESSLQKSFASFEDDKKTIRLSNGGSIVITLSLTTDSYSTQLPEMSKVNACIVLNTPNGLIKEECRIIRHSDSMVVPFQVFKVDHLPKGTMIHAYITDSSILSRQSAHNKLYLVLL